MVLCFPRVKYQSYQNSCRLVLDTTAEKSNNNMFWNPEMFHLRTSIKRNKPGEPVLHYRRVIVTRKNQEKNLRYFNINKGRDKKVCAFDVIKLSFWIGNNKDWCWWCQPVDEEEEEENRKNFHQFWCHTWYHLPLLCFVVGSGATTQHFIDAILCNTVMTFYLETLYYIYYTQFFHFSVIQSKNKDPFSAF